MSANTQESTREDTGWQLRGTGNKTEIWKYKSKIEEKKRRVIAMRKKEILIMVQQSVVKGAVVESHQDRNRGSIIAVHSLEDGSVIFMIYTSMVILSSTYYTFKCAVGDRLIDCYLSSR